MREGGIYMVKKIVLVLSYLFAFYMITYSNAEIEVKKEYYPNGQLRSEIPYKKGREDGIMRRYYPDGSLQLDVSYRDGKKEGAWKEYFPSYEGGKLLREYFLKMIS